MFFAHAQKHMLQACVGLFLFFGSMSHASAQLSSPFDESGGGGSTESYPSIFAFELNGTNGFEAQIGKSDESTGFEYGASGGIALRLGFDPTAEGKGMVKFIPELQFKYNTFAEEENISFGNFSTSYSQRFHFGMIQGGARLGVAFGEEKSFGIYAVGHFGYGFTNATTTSTFNGQEETDDLTIHGLGLDLGGAFSIALTPSVSLGAHMAHNRLMFSDISEGDVKIKELDLTWVDGGLHVEITF